MREDREERIHQLIALCVKNNLTPLKNAFAGFLQNVCISRFGIEKRTARNYIDSLIAGWRLDRWKQMLQENPYLTMEEKTTWITQHSPN